MHQSFNLGTLDWTVSGWHPWNWKLGVSMELGFGLLPEIAAVPARVPGSVQGALRDAKVLPDWNVGTQSRACEWVENRHWEYQTTLTPDLAKLPGRKVLRCEGLDYQGVVLLNGKQVGAFVGAFAPHCFDLTDHLIGDGPHKLSIVFTENPRALGQIGFTSQITQWKPRFNYVWDWTVRLVQIGIWDAIHLDVEPAIESFRAFTVFDSPTGIGSVTVAGQSAENVAQIEINITNETGELHRDIFAAQGAFSHTMRGLTPQPWQPNGNGSQPLYKLLARALDASGNVLDEMRRVIGFRHIEWKPCEGAPAGAEPWICSINGVDTFLQGINWVPPLPNFADISEDQYRKLLQAYKDIGLNVLRIWGGAVLEKEIFYRLCDEMGLMVWQEFPFSSSGIDNWPPEDPRAIDEMADIARSYIERRQHHASLLMWCGGNELQGGMNGEKVGLGKPIDLSHPMMSRLNGVVKALDPTRKFVATSSTGPRFTAEAKDFGKGLHHDVHGPWNHAGDLKGWEEYWDHDDALFRSESGFPGASPVHLVRGYGGHLAWPASKENPLWVHISSWWFQWDDYLRENGDRESLNAYVDWSQSRQARALGYAVRATKRRFPKVGGIILWMGHDCFPCPINTSILDYEAKPKPAAISVAEAFKLSGGRL